MFNVDILLTKYWYSRYLVNMSVPGAGHEAVSTYDGRGEDGGGAEHGGRVRGGGGGGHHQGRLAEVHDLAECCRGRSFDVARH